MSTAHLQCAWVMPLVSNLLILLFHIFINGFYFTYLFRVNRFFLVLSVLVKNVYFKMLFVASSKIKRAWPMRAFLPLQSSFKNFCSQHLTIWQPPAPGLSRKLRTNYTREWEEWNFKADNYGIIATTKFWNQTF